MQCEPRIPAQIRALARVRHRAEGELAVLEGRLDPGDPRRPVGSHGGNRLVSVPVEEAPHALRELRFRALDVLPRRHAPNIAQATEGELAGMSTTHIRERSARPSASQEGYSEDPRRGPTAESGRV